MPLHASSATFLILYTFRLTVSIFVTIFAKMYYGYADAWTLRARIHAGLQWCLSTSGAGDDWEQEYKKYRSTLEQEHRRGWLRARVEIVLCTINTGVHWRRSTCVASGELPEQEYNKYWSTRGEKLHLDKVHNNYKSTSEQERTASKITQAQEHPFPASEQLCAWIFQTRAPDDFLSVISIFS